MPLQVRSLECGFQKGVLPVQFPLFSLLGIMQHPVALKPEVKGQKNGEYVCSAQFFMPVSHPSYSLLLYRKEISAALYAAAKGGSQPCKAPT